MDTFVEAVRDVSIANYTTKNRIGATDIVTAYAGYGPAVTTEITKSEISLEDIFNGDSLYSEQIAFQYEAWKAENPDADISQEEFQQAAIHGRAFEYTSIKNSQQNKEFWVSIAAVVVIVWCVINLPAGRPCTGRRLRSL